MIFYLILPLFSLILIVLQTTILNFFFLGKMGLEVSLIAVVYAGFYLGITKGGILAFVLGFFLDCIGGSITGLYTFFYVVVFFVSRIVSFRVYAEGVFFIMAFTFVCGIAEGILIILLYQVIYGIDIFLNMFKTFLPQALVAGVLSPAIFTLLNFLERMVHVGESN
jgi:rod shape-determining protein MreD